MSTTNLVKLPPEILSQILGYLIPQGKTFRIRPYRNSDVELPNIPRKGGHPWKFFYSWTTHDFQRWEEGKYISCPKALPLLLLHPLAYTITIQHLYGNNTLWFQDLHTLRKYTSRFSPRLKAAVRSLAVDACGRGIGNRYQMLRFCIFEHEANIGIADTIMKFPRLQEMYLFGVGPGFCGQVVWPTTPTTPYDADLFYHLQESDSIRKAARMSDYETQDVWTVDGIELVAKLIGISATTSAHDGNRKEGESEGESNSQKCRTTELEQGPLFGARVLCANPNHPTIRSMTSGRMRLMGTRIVTADVKTQAHEVVKELLDIAEAIRRARIEQKLKIAYLKFRLKDFTYVKSSEFARATQKWPHGFSNNCVEATALRRRRPLELLGDQSE